MHDPSKKERQPKDLEGPQGKPAQDRPFLVDGHVDLTYFMMGRFPDLRLSQLQDGPFTLEKMEASGLRLFCNALYCEDTFNGAASQAHLREVLGFTLTRFDGPLIIRKRQDLAQVLKGPEKIGTILLLENADALAGSPALLDELLEAGIRIVGLTHAGKNRLGDGNGIFHSDGFSQEGRDVIALLGQRGLIVDVAHLHPHCFWQLVDLMEGLIISSHTGLRECCDIQRNIDLTQAREIVMRQGLVGITFNPEMLTPSKEASLESIFIHMDTLVQKFGPDGVAIGSDFCGFDSPAQGLEDITKTPKLIQMMQDHGYDGEAVAKILGRNWLRIYEGIFQV